MKCFTTGKTSITDEASAKRSADKFGLRAYKCQFCNKWHLTHKKRFKTMK